jgi:hypothetical protein
VGNYRDDLEAAHLRIKTLEAKLTAAEASAEANETEASELRRQVAILGDSTLRPAAPKVSRSFAMLAGLMVVGTVVAFAMVRAAAAPSAPMPAPVVTPTPPPKRAEGHATKPGSSRCGCDPHDRLCLMRCDAKQVKTDPPKPTSPRVDESVRAATEQGKVEARKCSGLSGRVEVRFTVQPGGGLRDVWVRSQEGPVAECVAKAFRSQTARGFHGEPKTVQVAFAASPEANP